MRPVNYDAVASEYDRRYERNRYDGVRSALHRFIGRSPAIAIAEAGCGTGHWLAGLLGRGARQVCGLDVSPAMLQRARAAAPGAGLVQASASRLPFADESLDRIFCINALHHFPDQQVFISECRRVLRAGGGMLTIGLDPHNGGDQWWVYDYFPGALQADLLRYPSAAAIRDWLGAAGFREAATEVAQHMPFEMPMDLARQQGFLDRHATSQLIVISDGEYDAGMERLHREQPVLRASLRMYGTTGWT